MISNRSIFSGAILLAGTVGFAAVALSEDSTDLQTGSASERAKMEAQVDPVRAVPARTAPRADIVSELLTDGPQSTRANAIAASDVSDPDLPNDDSAEAVIPKSTDEPIESQELFVPPRVIIPATLREPDVAPIRRAEPKTVHPFDSDEPFPYIALGQPISRVFEAYRSGLGIPVLGETDNETVVTVDGTGLSPRAFLDAATSQAGLEWYFDGLAIHIVGTDRMKSRLLDLGGVSARELEASLDQLGLSDPRFTIDVSGDADIAKVQGPEPFVEAVASLLKTLRARKTVVPTPKFQPATTAVAVALPATSTTSKAGPRVFTGAAR